MKNSKRQTTVGDVWAAYMIQRHRAGIARERIRAVNRERVAKINAQADMYCANVNERISSDLSATARYMSDAGQKIAMARMASEVIRTRGDLLIQASRERCEQFRMLSAQCRSSEKALSEVNLSPSKCAALQSDLDWLRKRQRELLKEARTDARQIRQSAGGCLALPEARGYRA